MPVALNPADRRLLYTAGGALVLILGVAFFLASGVGDRGDVTTSYSTASAGAKAAFLLLQTLGYQTDRWEDSPSALTAPATTTLILAEPLELPTDAERQALADFMAAGGRIIATGPNSAWVLPDADKVLPAPLGATTWSKVTAVGPAAVTRAAPAITIAKRAQWLMDDGVSLPLYADGDDLVVVAVPVGKGEAMWWAAATPLTNAGLNAPGNLAFFLAAVGPSTGRRVLWDEYFHGRRHTLAGSLWHSPVRWVGLQLGLLALVIVLTYSRRSGPIISPAAESRLAPLEFVRTLGSLYRRAGASTVPVEAAERRIRYWTARRFGVSTRASTDDLTAAVARRTGRDTTALSTALRNCERARGSRGLDEQQALAVVQALEAQAAAFDVFESTKEDR